MQPGKFTAGAVVALAFMGRPAPADDPQPDLATGFAQTVRPFVQTYCVMCHGGAHPTAQFDLRKYSTLQDVAGDMDHWSLVLKRLSMGSMPPKAVPQPEAEARRKVIDWIAAMRREEARKNAGDPGTVLAHRLSNAEYNYTIRDLTGVDIRPAREFPVDPGNPAGFDNSGESLTMSPALLNKYLQAAREVADHLVLKPDGIAFAPHPVLVETDRDKYCINRILDFYHRQDTDYADYFLGAWRYRFRAALGKPRAGLADFAAEGKLSPKYLATVWQFLNAQTDDVGPAAKLRAMWRELPAPGGNQPDEARSGCERMRDWVVQLRAKTEMRFPDLSVPGINRTSQPFLMWRNREYATHRLDYDRGVLQVEGELQTDPTAAVKKMEPQADVEIPPAPPPKRYPPDPDLHVPPAERAHYEAAFARFAAVFPDAFYISERGRYFPDDTRDKGRFLSAGFHNLMGYFRDDAPLYQLILDTQGQKELDELWKELDFIASANIRTYIQFYLFESKEAAKGPEGGAPIPENEITSAVRIRKVAEDYLVKARASKNPIAIQAVEEHFKAVNDSIRWVEAARIQTEPVQLKALEDFAARAYRRPLTAAERQDLLGYYRSLREKDGLSHEDAMRDSVVGILMAPDFCYRLNLLSPAAAKSSRSGTAPLSDYSLASRLSYFLWSSMPDARLLVHAAAGDLHRPEVLVTEAHRMLADERARGLAVEFATNWLDVRRFEEHNAVDRERFPSFTNDLREAMFEEPIRFFLDVARNNRPVLDFVYGKYTFVNAVLAEHYGMTGVHPAANKWVRVDDARPYGRGGLLPMAVFLTKNAPGLRTSPVKRGYWVVRRVLGEEIPPPPAAVPELPRDEAKMDLPLRDTLARHRQDPSCAACHMRFDSFGLALENYGPVGELRTKDLAGRPVDSRVSFPGGDGGDGLDGILAYIRAHRESDFIDSFAREMLVYALGRSAMLSDEPLIEEMHGKLAANGYHFETIIDSIVTSPQFTSGRLPAAVARKGE